MGQSGAVLGTGLNDAHATLARFDRRDPDAMQWRICFDVRLQIRVNIVYKAMRVESCSKNCSRLSHNPKEFLNFNFKFFVLNAHERSSC